jgi:biotin carboxyl carrier protein
METIQANDSRSSSSGTISADVRNEASLSSAMARILELSRQVNEPREYHDNCCEVIAEHFQSPYFVFHSEISGRRFEKTVHFGTVPAETWQQLCSLPIVECVSSQQDSLNLFEERNSSTRMAVITTPVRGIANDSIGVACILVVTKDASTAENRLSELQQLLRYMAHPQELFGPAGAKKELDRPLSFLHSFCAGKFWMDLNALSFELTNGLKKQLGCSDVSLGIVYGNSIRLIAISGQDSVYRRSPGCVAIEQAMSETLDSNEIIVVQGEGVSERSRNRSNSALHLVWRASSGNSSCMSLPLRYENEVIAVISFRRDEGYPFRDHEINELEESLPAVAERIMFARETSKSLWQHFKGSIAKFCGSYIRGPIRAGVLAASSIAAMIFLFCSWPHSINVPCRLITDTPKIYSAPYAGKISKVHFRSGDSIAQGAILFEMDTEELLTRKAKLEAELTARQQAMIRYLSDDETAKAGEERSNMTMIQQELSMIAEKIDQSTIRAEQSGTVVDSDLYKREGEIVALGEKLIEFAPEGSHEIELMVPDYLGLEIQNGQAGKFVTSADPDRYYSIAVKRVETSSKTESGESFIRAIGTTDMVGSEAKLGMAGFAQISVGSQPGWWIMLQKPIRYLQRKVWQL